MKDILDRHAARLTPEERRAVWQTISGPREAKARVRVRWMAQAAAVAAVVLVVIVVALARREPTRMQPAAPAKPVAAAPKIVAPAPAKSTAHPLRNERRLATARPSARARDLGARSARAYAPVIVPDTTLPILLPRAIMQGASSPRAAAPGLAPGTGMIAGRVTSKGQGIPFASVSVPSAKRGALTDAQGNFKIADVAQGQVAVEAKSLGYDKVEQTVKVTPGQTSTLDFDMQEKVVAVTREIQVSAERRIDTKASATKQTITAERLKDIGTTRAGTITQGGEPHVRGGRGGETKFRFDGLRAAPPYPPVVPITGGTRLPNDEAFDSMYFKGYGVNPFVATDEDPLSTFAVDVDAASYTLTRRYLGLGQLPPADAVRVEEFVNFFPQEYPRFENEDFRVVVDGAPSAFGRGYQLLRIGIKGREIAEGDRKPAQLTFVIDCSGSMERENRLELVKRALHTLVDRLRADDQVGIVVFGSNGRVLLDPVALGGHPAPALAWRRDLDDRDEDEPGASGSGRRRVLEAIERLHPNGSTNAEEGLRLGYDMARGAYRPGAINRIVLCSDGVANVGVTGPASILERVRTEADHGIHLTTIGFGMGNYNDVLMEQLADKGDGNHYYVDDLDEARRVLVENLTGTLLTIAKDAKVQVEFDSTRVLRYRLLGFENRDVADRDFRNDKVDAGEIGAGHEVTALYELKLAPGAAAGTLATIRLRYARPEQEGAGAPRVREIERRFDVSMLERRFEDAAPRFRLDAAVAEFAEILRGSYWAKEGRLADVLSVARDAAHDLRDPRSKEFVTLVEKAARLKERAGSGQP